ncbi:MAG: M23 family metallopeptidase [Longimicrobiales bacterium]
MNHPTARQSLILAGLALLIGCVFIVYFARAPLPPVPAPPATDSLRRDGVRRDSKRKDSVVAAPAAVLPAALPGLETGPPSLPSAVLTPRPTRSSFAEPLIIPVQGVRASQLRDTYSDARGSGRRHDAIDIMAPRGTLVIAAAPGVIVKQDNGERGGIAMYVLAPDQKTIYYYAHLDRYAEGMSKGRALQAGEVLGYVGNTGNAGPGNYHLHFEITTTSDPKRYWGGAPQNPYPLLQSGITR